MKKFRILIILLSIILFKDCTVIGRKKVGKKEKKEEYKKEVTSVEEKLRELEEEKLLQERQRKFVFDKYYNNAYNEYINANYGKALEWVRKALELYPRNESALNLETKIKSAMGEYTSEIKTTKEMLEERMKVYIESLKADIRSQIKKAEDFIKEEDYKSAKVIIKIVEDKLNLMPYDIGLAKEKNKIKELKKQIEKKLVEKERIEELRRKEAARRLAIKEELKRLQEKKREIKKLTTELHLNIKRKNYIEARRIANQILTLDPNNKNVSKILDIIRRLETEFLAQESLKTKREYEKAEAQRIKEREIPYSESTIIRYPERYKWEEILKKSEEYTAIKEPTETETPLMREINKKLQEFHEVKVSADTEVEVYEGGEKVTKKIEKYSDLMIYLICQNKLGLSEEQCVVSEEAQSKLEETINSEIKFEATVPISEIIKQVLNPMGLTYIVTPFGLNFVSKERQEKFIAKVYNISDIINPIRSYTDVETIDFVATATGGESPGKNLSGIFKDDTSDPGKIKEIANKIEEIFTDPAKLGPAVFNIPAASKVVRPDGSEVEEWPFDVQKLGRGQIYLKAPYQLHKKFSEYLTSLRQSVRLLVSIEARFLAVDDNFLEDIGVEWRGLRGEKDADTLSIVARDQGTEDVEPPLGKLPQRLSSGYIEGRTGSSRWEIKGRTQFPSTTLSGQIKNTGGLGLQIFPFSNNQMALTLRAINKKEKAIQLSAPRVIVFNNAYTYLRLIREITIIEKYTPQGSSIVPGTAQVKVGILILVKPIVSYDKKYITLEIVPQIVRLQGAPREVDALPSDVQVSEKPRAPIHLPWLVTQSAFTTIRVPDKGSIIIAGLRNILKAKMVERVPILGRIPIVGALFKRKQKVDEKRHTVIIITAEILDLQEQEKKNF